MHLDVQDLKISITVSRSDGQYSVLYKTYATGLTQRVKLVGFGFAVPLLRPFLAKSDVCRVNAGPQGSCTGQRVRRMFRYYR